MSFKTRRLWLQIISALWVNRPFMSLVLSGLKCFQKSRFSDEAFIFGVSIIALAGPLPRPMAMPHPAAIAASPANCSVGHSFDVYVMSSFTARKTPTPSSPYSTQHLRILKQMRSLPLLRRSRFCAWNFWSVLPTNIYARH